MNLWWRSLFSGSVFCSFVSFSFFFFILAMSLLLSRYLHFLSFYHRRKNVRNEKSVIIVWQWYFYSDTWWHKERKVRFWVLDGRTGCISRYCFANFWFYWRISITGKRWELGGTDSGAGVFFILMFWRVELIKESINTFGQFFVDQMIWVFCFKRCVLLLLCLVLEICFVWSVFFFLFQLCSVQIFFFIVCNASLFRDWAVAYVWLILSTGNGDMSIFILFSSVFIFYFYLLLLC